MLSRNVALLVGPVLSLLVVACSSADSIDEPGGGAGDGSPGVGGSAGSVVSTGGSSGSSGHGGSAGGNGGSAMGGNGGSAMGGSGGLPVNDAGNSRRFNIRFDYRFDKVGFFTAPERRAALEAAGAVWSRVIRDDFAPVPKGTGIRLKNPENRDEYIWVDSIEEDIDDLLVFVGTSEAIPGLGRGGPSGAVETSDPKLDAALAARRDGSDFQPWARSISFKASSNFFFDPTPATSDDIPLAAFDFITIAAHELGHVLGFSSCAAFTAFVSGTSFVGPAAEAAFGGPARFMPDVAHFASHTQSDGVDTLMDPGQTNGTRSVPTKLDLAVFTDLGYDMAK